MTTPAETLATAITVHAIAMRHGLALIAEAIERTIKATPGDRPNDEDPTPYTME